MEQTIHTITLDLQRPCNHGAVTVKKGDTHRTLRLRLLSGGRPYKITEDCYAVFTAQKPDGTVLYNSCAREGNTLLYRLTPQTTAAAGVLECEIKLYGPSDALITSAAFTLTVEDTVYTEGDEAITSTGEATALTQLISQATTASAEAKAVAEELLQAKEDGLFNGPQGEKGDKGDKGDAEGAVLYLAQTLTAAQQAQARENIGAASQESIGDMETALDSILAIQKELIGVNIITFTIDGAEYQAEAGMTWGEFIESDYNPEVVCDDCGETVKYFWLDGTNIEMFFEDMCSECGGAHPIVFTGEPTTGEGELVTPSDTIIPGNCYAGG